MQAHSAETMPRKEDKAPSPSPLRLDRDTYDALEALAKKTGLSRHSVTLLAIRRGLASIEAEREETGDLRFLVEEHVRAQVDATYKPRKKKDDDE